MQNFIQNICDKAKTNYLSTGRLITHVTVFVIDQFWKQLEVFIV